jgi:hypothetical protein
MWFSWTLFVGLGLAATAVKADLLAHIHEMPDCGVSIQPASLLEAEVLKLPGRCNA